MIPETSSPAWCHCRPWAGQQGCAELPGKDLALGPLMAGRAPGTGPALEFLGQSEWAAGRGD